MAKFIDLNGQSFGRLKVLKRAKNKGTKAAWLCECGCGNQTVVEGSALRSGNTRSCGCLQLELLKKRSVTHGEARHDGTGYTKEYCAWRDMKARCYNPTHSEYKNYGVRGIEVCKRWLNNYECFLADMGRCPDKSMSLDKIDNDSGYYPGNCRWTTSKVQTRNMRRNVWYPCGDKNLCESDMANEINISNGSLRHLRKKGMPNDAVVAHYADKYYGIDKKPYMKRRDNVCYYVNGRFVSQADFAKMVGVSTAAIAYKRKHSKNNDEVVRYYFEKYCGSLG